MIFRESLGYLIEEGFIIHKDGTITSDGKRPKIITLGEKNPIITLDRTTSKFGHALDSKVKINYQLCQDFEEFESAAKLAELCKTHNTPHEEYSREYAKRILEREGQIEQQNLYAQMKLLERYSKLIRTFETE